MDDSMNEGATEGGCARCGAELDAASRASGLCPRCAKLAHMRGTWKRQMRFYAAMMVAGAVVIVGAWLIFGGVEGSERAWFMAAALGGLGVLGGLFGLALAGFFHLWHREPEDDGR
ncbi:MAG: hypothetical protein R8K47_01030 [Mariprofundaceae bacterium]